MVSSTQSNAWRELPSYWQQQIASRVQQTLWNSYSKNSNFAAWCLRYYPNLVSGSPAALQATQRRTGQTPPNQEQAVRDIFPEWWFNHQLTTRERNSLLCTLVKLRVENLLDWVRDLEWVGNNCEINFLTTRGAEIFHQHLLRNGYGDWWYARKSGHRWGVRSRFRGLQLHFRSDTTETVNAHIDSFNPGDPPTGEPTGGASELGAAIGHKIADDWHRSTFDDPAVVWHHLVLQAAAKNVVLPWVH